MPRPATVIEVISQASMEIGIAQKTVTTAINSNDADIVQMLALLSAVADEVMLDEPYKISLGDGIWLRDTSGVPKDRATDDTDIVQFDARLAIDGLKYRFLKAKGLEFGEEMRDFVSRLNKLAGRINGRVLDLDYEEDRVL